MPYDLEAETAKFSTESLLKNEQVLAEAKQKQIGALIQERVKLAADTHNRLIEIAAELKSLGWHRSKTARSLTQGEAGKNAAVK